jgi:hypothetical protein
MMTAVATTAATTATISATNASMNADGNLAGSLDDVGKTALKDTTSKESIKNYAISAAVAGAAAWAVQASGGTATVEKGEMRFISRIQTLWRIIPNMLPRLMPNIQTTME